MNFKPENFIVNTVGSTLGCFGIKWTKSKLTEVLENHLHYPSLLSIKDVVSGYGIDSVAIRKAGYSYEDFETPYICSIQQKGWADSTFTLVKRASDGSLDYVDPLSGQTESISINDFEKIDKGYILLLDGGLAKDEKDFYLNRKKERLEQLRLLIPFVLVGMAVLLVSSYLLSTSHESWPSVSFLLGSLMGVLFSALLLWHEVDAHNPFLKEVCGANNNKMSCGAVLSSSGAKFAGFSWSVIGAAYFTTFLLSQLLFANQSISMFWSWISIALSPYIIYSLIYQWRVVRQWCRLCLGVQVVLLVMAIVSLLNIGTSIGHAISWYPVLATIGLGLVVLFVFSRLVPLLRVGKDSKDYKKRWKKMRYNPDVFQALLSKGDPVSIPVDGLGIVIGNPDATCQIIKVCNPFCGPCAKAHPELEQIVKTNPDVNVRIIFTAKGEEDDIKTAPVQHLLAIDQVYGSEVCQQALDDWYLPDIKDYAIFSAKYPMNGELQQQKEKIKTMSDWCDAMKIRSTPTLFINGREYPEGYGVEELKDLL